jgi:hypothetical protein
MELMLSILSVPDKGYSRNTLCALNLISTKTNNYPSPSLSGTTIYDVGNPGPDLGT